VHLGPGCALLVRVAAFARQGLDTSHAAQVFAGTMLRAAARGGATGAELAALAPVAAFVAVPPRARQPDKPARLYSRGVRARRALRRAAGPPRARVAPAPHRGRLRAAVTLLHPQI
jgi:hypothetical protein